MGKPQKEVHVTELTGPDDRWVSVTDASRIARRQEHTIRTWVAQGVLPVNPQRVGINKKTRQVRLSDLIKLTPIIDPDAGIATDLGTLDLPSIPKQQQQLMEQMAALQQEVTGQLANLGGQLRDLAEKHGQFAEETHQAWQVHQQQYQALAHRDEEQQQFIQGVQDILAENLHSVDQAIRQELGNALKLHSLLDERVKAQDQAFQQAQQELRDLITQTESMLHREMAGLVAQIEQRREAHEDLAVAVTHLNVQTDQQFSQVGNRLGQLETATGQQQNEIQKQGGRVGQLETELSTQIGQLIKQLAGLQSTWQEQATTAENEARQLRRDLDAQSRGQQALQKQLDEERRAREELARRVERLLRQPKGEKGKGREQGQSGMRSEGE
jgi:chromosome segregation ATPase